MQGGPVKEYRWGSADLPFRSFSGQLTPLVVGEWPDNERLVRGTPIFREGFNDC